MQDRSQHHHHYTAAADGLMVCQQYIQFTKEAVLKMCSGTGSKLCGSGWGQLVPPEVILCTGQVVAGCWRRESSQEMGRSQRGEGGAYR